MHEDKTRGIWVGGATELYVGAREEVIELMRQASQNRAKAATSKRYSALCNE